MALGARRVGGPTSRVLEKNLATLRSGEEQVGWENSKSKGSMAIFNRSLAGGIAR